MWWETGSTSVGNDEDAVLFVQLEGFFRRKGYRAEQATILAYKAMDSLDHIAAVGVAPDND